MVLFKSGCWIVIFHTNQVSFYNDNYACVAICAYRPVARFQGLGSKFLFPLLYLLKTNFSGRNKIWGQKTIWGALPPNSPLWLRACVRTVINL